MLDSNCYRMGCEHFFLMIYSSVFILVSAEGPDFFHPSGENSPNIFALHVGHCAVIFVTSVWAERAQRDFFRFRRNRKKSCKKSTRGFRIASGNTRQVFWCCSLASWQHHEKNLLCLGTLTKLSSFLNRLKEEIESYRSAQT